ncbi:MAG: hypothetical protein N2657_02790 [bacterium]|nr:hypothetical protein [bacterium]
MDQNRYNANYIFGNIVDEILSVDLDYIFSIARSKRKDILRIKTEDIIRVIDKVSSFWLDENNPLYPLVFEKLSNLGFSNDMLKLAIKELSRIFLYENLSRRLLIEFGSSDILDNWVGDSIKIRAFPIGVLTHITAGNVFVSSIDSLICGLITKNINIIKTSSKVGNSFGILWIESLKIAEKNLGMEGLLSDKIVIFSYPSDNLIDYLNKYSDGVVVWGSYDTIKFFSSNFDPKKKLIIYGPKYSICVIDEDNLKENLNNQEFYDSLAWDICLWEQRACSSVQTIYIVGNPSLDYLETFCQKLSKSISEFKIPQGELSFDEYTEIFKYEDISIANTVLGKGKYFNRVYLEYLDEDFFIGPLNRFVCVKKVDNIDKLVEVLKPYSDILQSCSLKVSNSDSYIDALSNCGITRFVKIGNIGFSEIFVPHEGEYILRRFSKIVSRSEV